jgi:hypothetical protein
MAKWRTIQPPHQSEKFTLEEAIEAWRRVEARAAAKQQRRGKSAAGHLKETAVSKPSPPARARVAADYDEAP